MYNTILYNTLFVFLVQQWLPNHAGFHCFEWDGCSSLSSLLAISWYAYTEQHIPL